MELPLDAAELINAGIGGWDQTLGLHFVSATPDRVEVTLDVGPQHLQPYGLVHGGVYASIVEAVCSVGAGVRVFSDGLSTVGLENQTSFLRAVRSGTLRAVATPTHAGRRSQVWAAEIRDAERRLVATGSVRILCLPRDAQIAGGAVSVELGE